MSSRSVFGIAVVLFVLALFGPWSQLSPSQADSGTVSLPANVTSTVVTHGLGFTPSRVLLTPQGRHSTTWWVETKGTTSFKIETATSSTTPTLFDWRVSGDD